MKFVVKNNTLFKCLYLFALAALVGSSSCRSTRVPYTSTKSEPYVQLKSGKKYEGTSAERSTGLFVKDKIVLGDTSFKTKDVAFYSTGSSVFANVGRKTMAQQVADGKINLYRYTSTSTTTTHYGGSGYSGSAGFGSAGGHTSTQNHTSYYIQSQPGKPVEKLTYRNLATMVEINTPEYKMLERYRKTRVVSRSLGYGGIGLMAGGIVLASAGGNSTAGIGAAMAGIGFAALWPWAGIYMTNQVKLLKSVLIADKSDKIGKHKRVN